MIYLTLPELLHTAERALGHQPEVRDYGLLESSLARPQATAFGSDWTSRRRHCFTRWPGTTRWSMAINASP